MSKPERDVNLNIGFKRRPPRRHPVLDYLAFFACAAFIGVTFGSALAFYLSFAIMTLIYAQAWRRHDEGGTK